jgi:hypothetical protein
MCNRCFPLCFALELTLVLACVPAAADIGEALMPGRVVYGNAQRTTDAEVKGLASHAEVEDLRLARCRITDAGLEYLKGMKKLRLLELSDTKITDAGLKQLQLQSHPELKYLWIDGTRVTDAGLQYVARMPSVQSLAIGGRIGDAGLKHLAGTGLLSLYIGDNDRVTDTGLGYVAQMPDLWQFLLKRNHHITDVGVRSLRRLKRLSELTLCGDRITNAGLKKAEVSATKSREDG